MVNRVAEDALQGNNHSHGIISLLLKKSMKKDQELIVITKTYDLILWSCNHTSKFPRNHRFVLGERIERNLYEPARNPDRRQVHQEPPAAPGRRQPEPGNPPLPDAAGERPAMPEGMVNHRGRGYQTAGDEISIVV